MAAKQLRLIKEEERERRNEAKSKSLASPVDLRVGQRVWLQDQRSGEWSIPGKVVEVRPSMRSAVVEARGKFYTRNRRYIREDKLYEEEEVNCVMRRSRKMKSILKKRSN